MSRICVYEEDGQKWIKPCMVMKSIAFAIKFSDAADDNVTLAIPMSVVLGVEPAAAL